MENLIFIKIVFINITIHKTKFAKKANTVCLALNMNANLFTNI